MQLVWSRQQLQKSLRSQQHWDLQMCHPGIASPPYWHSQRLRACRVKRSKASDHRVRIGPKYPSCTCWITQRFATMGRGSCRQTTGRWAGRSHRYPGTQTPAISVSNRGRGERWAPYRPET